MPVLALPHVALAQAAATTSGKAGPAPSAAFDVVSIKPSDGSKAMLNWGMPNQYIAYGMPLLASIVVAYTPVSDWMNAMGRKRILGAPSWVGEDDTTSRLRLRKRT